MLNMRFQLLTELGVGYETLDCLGPCQRSSHHLGLEQQDWYLMIIRRSYAALPYPAATNNDQEILERGRHDCCHDERGTRGRGGHAGLETGHASHTAGS